MRKARTEGLAATVQSVRGRLAEDMPLGYSAAGEVVDVGLAVSDIQVGQLVATGGAGDPHPGAAQAHRPLGRPGPRQPVTTRRYESRVCRRVFALSPASRL